jgi:N-hydroxyarylamine O-acetyltransferase
MSNLDVDAYLDRIAYPGPRTPTAAVLRDLQVAHLLAVPFENLSIHAGEPIELEIGSLFDKIVKRRRGGFCYEANGLFAALLRALGFDVSLLSAAVARPEGGFGADFDHMALLVKLEEPWLVDVGFGDSFRQPLRLDERGEQVQGRWAYRIAAGDDGLSLQQREAAATEWETRYYFTLHPYTYADFAAMCHYHQVSPQSPFTQRRVCSQATAAGRLTLSGMRLIATTLDGERHERLLQDEEEVRAVLLEEFGIRNW